MNILLNINDIFIENIFLMDRVRNTVLENSDFTKIIYSNEFVGLNGIYLKIVFTNYKIDYFNNKIKYNLNNESNHNIIEKLCTIEKNILNYYNKNINHQYNLQKQLHNGIYKCNINDNKLFVILKISGIWQNQNCCGLTFKFI